MRDFRLFKFLYEVYRRYIDDEISAYAAEMAYYFILSLFPFLIFLITIIGYLPISSDGVLGSLSGILPKAAYEIVEKNIVEIVDKQNSGLMSFGFITTFWAASSGIRAIIRGINKALCDTERHPFLKSIMLSLIFTLLIGFVMILYFVLLVFGDLIGDQLIGLGISPEFRKVWNYLRYLISIALMIFVFTALYRYSPCQTIKWRDAVPGAIFTTIGWLIISLVFSVYVNRFWDLTLIYGGIGGIIALLIWLNISSQLILLGGEINAVIINQKLTSKKIASNKS